MILIHVRQEQIVLPRPTRFFNMSIAQFVYYAVLLIGLLVGIVDFKKLEKPAKYLCWVFAFIFCKEIYGQFLSTKSAFNLWFYRAVSPVDSLCLLLIFYFSKFIKLKTLFVLVLCLVSFFLIDIFYLQVNQKGIDSYFKFFKGSGLIIISLWLLYKVISSDRIVNFMKHSLVWVALGIILFYSISMFYWGVFNFSIHRNEFTLLTQIRPYFEIGNYFMYSCFILGLKLNNFYNHKSTEDETI